ncbi:MAG: type II toxin-antitoxin system HicA family toxin [Clostridiales bacterium]|jgi:predicted RNA binding protein YcfA (HicA-like mRNA interferase family)|nr:type II toxin-antitoxin system HicA family toxin [Clostridiales bacterium]
MNRKVYEAVLSGNSDNNIRFIDFRNLMLDLGFEFKRQRGSHTIYFHEKYNVLMNIQKDGSKAKSYQVEQLRNIILKYNL